MSIGDLGTSISKTGDIPEDILLPERNLNVLGFIGLVLGICLTRAYNYLLFHSLAEMFSIFIACGIFMFAWNARQFLKNNYLIFIGIAYLFIAFLDVLHTLSYSGMGVFEGFSTNLATQLWIVARYVESLSFLIAFFLFQRKPKANLIFFSYTVILSIVLISIFYWDIFPVCFIEGVGLTPFKKVSEYAICLILLAAVFMLRKKRKEFDLRVFRLLTTALIITIVSELVFTFYVHAFDFLNMAGHILKIMSFYLIYKAVIETGFMKPYHIMFRNLSESNEHLKREIGERIRVERLLKARQEEIEGLNANLEKRVREEVEKSRQKDHVMMHQSRLAAMGEMIGLIAHQWRQPLNAINLILYNIKDLFENDCLDEEMEEELTSKGISLVRKMSTTIDDFRHFFKPNNKKTEFDVNKIIKDALTMMEASLKYSNINVKFVEDGKIETFGIANEYSQVMLNILNNAKDAVIEKGENGEIIIDVFAENDNTIVKVRDNGGGISENVMNNIFEPYFTTKKSEDGTGLGLYMSKVIIEDHMDGAISVQNIEGGVEFTISTPRVVLS